MGFQLEILKYTKERKKDIKYQAEKIRGMTDLESCIWRMGRNLCMGD